MLKRELRRLAYMAVAFVALEVAVFAAHPSWRIVDHLDYIVVGVIGGLIGGYATDFLIIPWRKRRSSKPQP
jgi:hypothetical protein